MTAHDEIRILQARIAYLEDNRRYIQNALENVLSLGDFQTSAENPTGNVTNVLEQAGRKIGGIISFSKWAFYLVNDESFLFELVTCEPPRDRADIESEVDRMIEQELFAWAVREKRSVFIPAKEETDQFLLHVISTDNRIRGMFVGGLPAKDATIADTSLMLLSIVLLRVAHALEDIDFRSFLENQKEILEEQVEQRTSALTLSEAKLKAAMEQARELATEAKNASEAKSDFLAKMSHELRTPLNGIIGMTEVALATNLDATQKQVLRIVDRESNVLLKIINDILDFSKVEAGKLELEKIEFDLRAIIEEVGDTMATQAGRKGLELNTFLHPCVPTLLHGDPLRLKQILLNLAGNAIKFTELGEIRITGQLISETDRKATIRLMVQDTGIGIPKEKHAAIFQGFSQADDSTTRKYGGTGLGITISNQLVTLMGGTLGVQSEEDKGSTFGFTLSFDKQTDDAGMQTDDCGLPPLRVLVAGIASSGRKALIDYLEALECIVEQVDDGRAAWERLAERSAQEKPFGLVFTSVCMPEMTGDQLAARIKTLPDDIRIPVVAVTGLQEQTQGAAGQFADFDFRLSKPLKWYSIKTLLHSIRQGSELASDNGAATTSIAKDALDKNKSRHRKRILLVDDYPTNRKVAGMHLTSAGYRIDMAEDGHQAVEAFHSASYDLILMDIQMPTMDGYSASEEIRRIENRSNATSEGQYGTVKTHTPIIAMTAHVFREDEEKCRSAGMDGFISKPIRRDLLLRIVDRWTGQNDPAPPNRPNNQGAGAAPPPSGASVPMDFPTAVEEFGSRHVVMEVVRQLIANIETQMETMTQALNQNDARRLQRESHAIKGGAWTVEASPLGDVAEKIEHHSRDNDLSSAGPLIDTLGIELRRLKAYVETMGKGE